MNKSKVLWGLALMGLVIAWAIVGGTSRAFFPMSIPVVALYSATGSWGWSTTPYQLLVDLVPTLIFLAGAYRAAFYSMEWENRAFPLLLALTATLLAYALLEIIFPAFAA